MREQRPAPVNEPTADAKAKGKKTETPNAGETTAGDHVGVADWFVAAFTLALVVVAVLQWRTLKQQAKYMKSVLRPKLNVRNVEIDVDSLLGGEPMSAAGMLQIYNSGGTNARVSGATCKLFAIDKLPMKAPFESPIPFSREMELAPGTYETRSFSFDATDFRQFKGISHETIGLYVMGELIYSDDLGFRRTARFCRLFDWEKKRFFPVIDPDYETTD